MNRLTADNGKGNYYFPECFERCNGIPGNCVECDLNTKMCQALGAYEDTGLTPEQIVAMKNTTALNPVNIHGAAFVEAEEQLNNELMAAIRILRKSSMFEGRVTMAIVISDKGENVRPILYPTKYTPKKQNPEEYAKNLPGQLTFDKD